MAAAPCIRDSDCIALAIDETTGELYADPILDPEGCLECTIDGLGVELDPDGGIVCGDDGLYVENPFIGISADACNDIEQRADGIWVGQQAMAIACNSQPESFTGPYIGATPEIIGQSGEILIQNPLDCAAALGVRMEAYGTVQVSGATGGVGGTAAASRLEVTTRSRTKRGPTAASTIFAAEPFIDSDFKVLENNTPGSSLEFAWGSHSNTVPICPVPLAPGEWERFGYQRVARNTRVASSVATVRYATVFLTYWLVALA